MSTRRGSAITIQMGLMAVPAKMYAVASPNESRCARNLLHTTCMSRVKRPDWCPKCERVVDRGEITKGYNVGKDQYVEVTDAEIDALLPPGTKGTFEITGFVDAVDPLYWEKSWDLGADKVPGVFDQLVGCMHALDKVAIGRVALNDRDQLACLRESNGVLFLTTLYYESEMRATRQAPIPNVKSDLLELFKKLASDMMIDFKPESAKDLYYERFTALITQKQQDPKGIIQTAAAGPTAVMDIATALRQTLERTPKAKRGVKKIRKEA